LFGRNQLKLKLVICGNYTTRAAQAVSLTTCWLLAAVKIRKKETFDSANQITFKREKKSTEKATN